MLIRKLLFISLWLLFSVNLSAQWDLKRCVDYAMANNITVKISDVDAKMSDETYRQTKLSRWPSVSFNSSSSVNSGSTQNPVTYERTTETYFNAGFQLQTSADIFNFFNKQNTVAAYEWELLASKANVDKLRNDIALVVANAFLQILLAMEQEQITQVKIKQTIAQLDNTRKQVTAGTLPELSATLLEAQLAQDSVNYITAVGSVSQSILSIKSYMNIDAAAPFEIVAPPVESIPVQLMADLQPENVYSLALANQPLQRSNEYKLKAAEKFSKAAWGAKYPSFAAYGTLTSGYNNQGRKVTGITLANPPLGQVQVSGSDYLVYPVEPYRIPSFGKSPFFDQVSDNFGQNVGISMSVPLFNGGYLSSNYEKSKLNISRLQLQKQQDDQKLKQDIYQAYNDAIIALEKYNASKKGISANEKAYEIASKRYEVGMLGTYDLITAQNNLFRARLENSLNQFDYVFKLKVLEFYKGLGLTL